MSRLHIKIDNTETQLINAPLQQLFDSGYTFLSEEPDNDTIYLEHPETGCILEYSLIGGCYICVNKGI